MTTKEINRVVKEFSYSAKLAYEAGYDGIEIHMAHGYLVHEFCSPVTNKRSDEFGLKNNSYKFPLDILKSIKKNLPKKKNYWS